jgi:hypothetical protein
MTRYDLDPSIGDILVLIFGVIIFLIGLWTFLHWSVEKVLSIGTVPGEIEALQERVNILESEVRPGCTQVFRPFTLLPSTSPTTTIE